MSKRTSFFSALLVALLFCVISSGIGLVVNAVRSHGIQLIAPFPYQHDCPEKIDLSGPTITAQQALEIAGEKTTLFIDARPAELYQKGHIPGAKSLPYSFINPVTAESAAKLRSFKHLIVYCDSPDEQLARLQAKVLQKLGLRSVKTLKGGWDAFQKVKAKNKTK